MRQAFACLLFAIGVVLFLPGVCFLQLESSYGVKPEISIVIFGVAIGAIIAAVAVWRGKPAQAADDQNRDNSAPE